MRMRVMRKSLVGQISRDTANPVQPLREKYFASVSQNYDYRNTIPPRYEGRIAIVTKREAGSDGRDHIVRHAMGIADGESVWSWRPWAGAKSIDDDLWTTVTMRSRTPGRARYKP